MWSGILKVKLILSAQLPASPTTDILLPSRSFICGVEKLAMIFTVADGNRCFRSKKKEKKKKPANCLVFRFQTCSAAECPKLPEGAAMISYGAADTFAQGLIPDFSAKGKDPGDPIIFGFQSWGPTNNPVFRPVYCLPKIARYKA